MGLVEEFALEIRTSTAHATDLEHPDRMVFELEPGENVAFGAVARAAKVLRALLQSVALESFVMTRGERGVDVIVPVKPELDARSLRRFGTLVIDTLVAAAPMLYTSKHDVPQRDEIRLDTAPAFVAPYSTQLLTNAPIALPAFWYELEELDPATLTPAEVIERLRTLAGDPWETMASLEQRITRDHESSLAHALHHQRERPSGPERGRQSSTESEQDRDAYGEFPGQYGGDYDDTERGFDPRSPRGRG